MRVGETAALLAALALGASAADAAQTLLPHVPLVLWSQRATFAKPQTYVNAVIDSKQTAFVLHNALAHDTAKDNYNVLNHDGAVETAEALCVFVHKDLQSAQLAEFGADSFVQSAVKTSTSSVVIAHTTRSQSLTQELTEVAHPTISIDKVDEWIQSAEGQKLLSNGKADLLLVEVTGSKMEDVDAQIKRAANALSTAAKGSVDFALTGDEAKPVTAKSPFGRRRLATGKAVTVENIICDAGYHIGLSSTGKAFCFSHYVRMTPQILTALIFGFFFLFLAYVGLSVLHAIQTPQRYPAHGPPKGKEF